MGQFGRASPLGILLTVATDTRVVPIGNEKRTVGGSANVCWAEPLVFAPGHQRLDRCRIAGTGRLDGIGPHGVRARIAVNHLVMETGGQQSPFVDQNAARRTGAGLQQVGNDARVIKVPMAKRDLRFRVDPVRLPIRAGQFVPVAIIPVLHHEIDPGPAVAIVVIVALPQRPK